MKRIISPTEAFAKKQIKGILAANFKNNPAKLREATGRLINCLPPCDAKLMLVLIAAGEIEPSIDALVEGLIASMGGAGMET